MVADPLPLFPDLPATPPPVAVRRARTGTADEPPLPCAPLPGFDCYRHAAPSSPAWQSAQEFCDRYLAETDPEKKRYYHDMMISALLALPSAVVPR